VDHNLLTRPLVHTRSLSIKDLIHTIRGRTVCYLQTLPVLIIFHIRYFLCLYHGSKSQPVLIQIG